MHSYTTRLTACRNGKSMVLRAGTFTVSLKTTVCLKPRKFINKPMRLSTWLKHSKLRTCSSTFYWTAFVTRMESDVLKYLNALYWTPEDIGDIFVDRGISPHKGPLAIPGAIPRAVYGAQSNNLRVTISRTRTPAMLQLCGNEC